VEKKRGHHFLLIAASSPNEEKWRRKEDIIFAQHGYGNQAKAMAMRLSGPAFFGRIAKLLKLIVATPSL
jgi:hypothetical protein